jgi:acyl-coenzyme A thioesterase PaaI-like protein
MGSSFIATATISRLGGRVGSTQMALHNDQGLLIATGAGAYVVS